jgi:signal transduction histidine kinase
MNCGRLGQALLEGSLVRQDGIVFTMGRTLQGNLELKFQFQKDQEMLLRFRVNIILLMGVCLVPLFGVIDYFLYPQYFLRFMVYRSVVSCVCLLLFIFNRMRNLGSWSLYLGVAAYYLVGLCIVKMIIDLDDILTPYWAGLGLVFIGFSVVLPLGVKLLLPHCMLLYFFYFGLAFPSSQPENIAYFLASNAFLFSTLVIVISAAHVSHSLRWREYLLKVELQKMQDELRRYSESLEDMVEEKHRALIQKELRLRFLSSHLLTAQERERRRISLELHDELGQSLTLLKLQVGSIEKKLRKGQKSLKETCESTLNYIDKMIEDVRRLARDLSPSILEDLGFSAAIRWLFKDFAEHSNIKISLNIVDVDPLFDREAQIILYRIFQEALANIGKHAHASQVSVAIKQNGNSVSFQVEDNGSGFNPEEVESRSPTSKSLGLAAMHERARMLGGLLDISSQQGRGTTIALSIPVNSTEKV